MSGRALFVLCTNDFPYKVLPDGTTLQQANVLCERLNAADRGRPSTLNRRRVYYHVHPCGVEEPDLIREWNQ